MMQIPYDCELMTEKYKIDKGGCCGQSCLAVIENISIQEVFDNWDKLGIEFKGYSGWKQLREYLEKKGFFVKQLKTNFKGFFNMDIYFIARVQWFGEGEKKEKPFYGWGHWSQASAYTHFVLIHDDKFFCNETGIDNYDNFKNYLKENNGIVTSYLMVSKEKFE
jgi:hypothetical protein